MFAKIKTSFELVKLSFFYIKRDPELIVYTLLSFFSTLFMILAFAWVDIFFFKAFENYSAEQGSSEIFMYVYFFVFFFVFSFITFFFNTAIITSIDRRIKWENNDFWDWLRDAMKNIKQIAIWSAISALVSTLLKIIQSKFPEDSLIWRIIVWMIGWMWNVLTFFSFPLMILNKVWPKDAIKQSGELFKKTWGERAILHVWVWFFFLILIILLIIFSTCLIIFIPSLTGYAFIFLFFAIISIILISSTTDVIIKTVLLYYANNGALPEWEWNAELFKWIAIEK